MFKKIPLMRLTTGGRFTKYFLSTVMGIMYPIELAISAIYHCFAIPAALLGFGYGVMHELTAGLKEDLKLEHKGEVYPWYESYADIRTKVSGKIRAVRSKLAGFTNKGKSNGREEVEGELVDEYVQHED